MNRPDVQLLCGRLLTIPGSPRAGTYEVNLETLETVRQVRILPQIFPSATPSSSLVVAPLQGACRIDAGVLLVLLSFGAGVPARTAGELHG